MPHHYHILRRKLFMIMAVLSLLVVIAFALAGAALYRSHQQAKHDRVVLCTAQNHSNDVLRQVITLAKHFSDRHGASSPFYQQALKLIKPIHCKLLVGS